jgi:DNA-directed RNA polymerase specialized sigma24 family protein
MATEQRTSERIGPAAESPRAAEQFPYRPRPGHPEDAEEIRDEAGRVLGGIGPMIAMLTRRVFPSAQDADHDEYAAHAAAYFVTNGLPKYDVRRGAKLTTFAFAVLYRDLLGQKRKAARRADREQFDAADLDAIPTPDPRPDLGRKAAAIAEDARAAAGLTRRQAEAVAASTGTHRPLYAVAADLGLASPSSLSTIRRRARWRIEAIDPEDIQQTVPSPDPMNFQQLTGWTLAEAQQREPELMRLLPAAEASTLSLLIAQSHLTAQDCAERIGVDAQTMSDTFQNIKSIEISDIRP